MTDPVADQLCDDVEARIITPTAALLGVDLHDILRERIEQSAPRIAAELSAPDTAASAARDLMSLLWGDSDPAPHWWQTPLGRAVAGGLHDRTDPLTHAESAAMLGVTRGTVATLVHRGTLARHPDGGVLAASVMQRLHRGGQR